MKKEIKKVLVIGSGPIVIGQAAEFDYAGTQACLALREEDISTVLVNSNPATIMTDPLTADKIYMEPLNADSVKKIIEKERPDAIIPGTGGQTGLNLAVELAESGVLDEFDVKIIGTPVSSIKAAEDRELFKELCRSIDEPVIESELVCAGSGNLKGGGYESDISDEEIKIAADKAKSAASRVGYPVISRPSFTLGGTGSGFAQSPKELEIIAEEGLRTSPAHSILIEKSVLGWKEIEFEMMRDESDKVICVCTMENIDPCGIHTGDSAVCAPALSLSDEIEEKLLRSAEKIIRALNICGGCNIQFAVTADNAEYKIIEVNPRVSRSSALASKASGYPIARVSAKTALGLKLSEISIYQNGQKADCEPKLEYLVMKLPRFPFDRFPEIERTLGTQMKSTGEVMGIGSCLEEALLKAVRSLDAGYIHYYDETVGACRNDELQKIAGSFDPMRMFAVFELLRRGEDPIKLEKTAYLPDIFIRCFINILVAEKHLINHPGDREYLEEAKGLGFSDAYIAKLWNAPENKVKILRRALGIRPVFRRAGGFEGSGIPYFFSSYSGENESSPSGVSAVCVLGAGPIRIGQGIEFDYSTVHAAKTLRESGHKAIIINNNPETVSTDWESSDKLYFDPLTKEDVSEILDHEQPEGTIASLGGQTALDLAQPLTDAGYAVLGTSAKAIELTENRDSFEKLLESLNIPKPEGRAVLSIEEGLKTAEMIGFPVLVRPSFVLGGLASKKAENRQELSDYLDLAFAADNGRSVLIDRFIEGKEAEIDAVSDGENVFIPAVMEMIEPAGIHSGDSVSILPPFSLTDETVQIIKDYTVKLGLASNMIGLFNMQFVIDKDDNVSVLELNPRSSRTVPFVSKATGIPLADIASKVIAGEKLKDIKEASEPLIQGFAAKVPVFSFEKLPGLSKELSPQMRSTGEAVGFGSSFKEAAENARRAAEKYHIKKI